MAINPGTARLAAVSVTPPAPSAGYVLLYFKTDNVLYIQGSDAVEHAIGTSNDITSLTGDVTATGPGAAAATVVQVGGKLASQIAQSVTDTQNATALNIANTIVKRDGSGNFVVGTITGNLSGNATTATTAGNFAGSLAGDVTGTQSSTVVAFVGGSSAANVHSAELAANAATPSNTINTIVKRDGSNNFSANIISASLNGNASTATLASNFSGSLSGDVSGTQSTTSVDKIKGTPVSSASPLDAEFLIYNNIATQYAPQNMSGDVSMAHTGAATVNSVGGSSASNINTAEIAANAATPSNTPSTIVKRDSSGNFSAGVITANLTGNVTGNVSGSSGSFTGSLSGDVTGTQSSTVVATVGGKTSSEVAQSVSDTQAATSADTPSTIVKRDGSGDIFITQVNGVVPEAHASRHLPSGADPLTTAAPISDLTATTANSVGTANSFSRSDHGHAIDTGAASTQTPDQSNAVGSSANLARADHTHNIPTGVASGLDSTSTNTQGSAAAFARQDHTHHISSGIPSTQTPDQANTAGSSANFAKADHGHNIPSGVPVQIGTSNAQGAAASFSLSDHIHSHGNQTSGTLHAAATQTVNGFMSSTDKIKTDTELPASLGTSNQMLGVNNAGTAGEYKSLNGTTNQIIITDAAGSKTFATPQDIATSSQPTFAGENLTDRLQFTQTTTPATPAATKADIYVDANQGFSKLRYLDETGSIQTILRDTIFLTYNNSGGTINKGQAVYITGAFNSFITIGLAKANSSTTMSCIGLAYENISNNSYGRVITIGFLTGFDTTAFSAGDKVFVSATTAGSLVNVAPTSPPNMSQKVGTVTLSAVSGTVEVRPQQVNGTQSGTNRGFTLNTVTLTDAANIATDASLGNIFTVTLGGNRNLSAPTNPTDGQKITYRITQDATGGRGLTFDAVFSFGLDILSFTPSSGANKIDYIGCIYSSTSSKWHVVAVAKGF